MGYFEKRRTTSDTASTPAPIPSGPRPLSTPVPLSYSYLPDFQTLTNYPDPSNPRRGERGGPSTRPPHLIPVSISPDELANFLELDPRIIHSICNTQSFRKNYCRRGKPGSGQMAIELEGVRRILRDLHELTGRPIDRVSLLLWMVESRILEDSGSRESRDCKPFYEAKVEAEIERIAKLEQPARTIMAVELLERYRDAGVLAEAVAEAPTTATVADAGANPAAPDEKYYDKANRLRREREWAKKLETKEMIRAQKLLDKPVKSRKDRFKSSLERMAKGS